MARLSLQARFAFIAVTLSVCSRAFQCVEGTKAPAGSYTIRVPKTGIPEDNVLKIQPRPSQSVVVWNEDPQRVRYDPLEIQKQVYPPKGDECDTGKRVTWTELFPEVQEDYPFVDITSNHEDGVASAILIRTPDLIYMNGVRAQYCFLLKDLTSNKQYTVLVTANAFSSALSSAFFLSVFAAATLHLFRS
ncbi:transmembrane protein [Cystoisospora suis]|uniref:Transmembrane protein n=1 Tax=Cystoisospora suis TaxID=483139 RepID=A0A2C6KLW7_9APIC|nr:transmembrane protein [Cystoisospora suis]